MALPTLALLFSQPLVRADTSFSYAINKSFHIPTLIFSKQSTNKYYQLIKSTEQSNCVMYIGCVMFTSGFLPEPLLYICFIIKKRKLIFLGESWGGYYIFVYIWVGVGELKMGLPELIESWS